MSKSSLAERQRSLTLAGLKILSVYLSAFYFENELIGIRLGFAYIDVPVEELSSNLNLSPLALRRDVADVVLLWKIVNGHMNCPDLLAEIDLRVPANTRSRDLLGQRYHSTNFCTVLSQGLFAWEIRLRLGVTCSSMDFARFVGRPPLFFFL
ncbi:hypothetical protein J6590_011129 [Homalodisca vitripennis]|nr:hypothetical protein J6590_011129 [Homalodisca vitripennis]